jgi:hypothetical protein
MPRALEVLDQTVRQFERGEDSALEVIDTLFAGELTLHGNRRVKMALRMAKLSTVKALAGFRLLVPALSRQKSLALEHLGFIDRNEVIHFLGPPETGKSHLATVLGVEAVKADRGVYFSSLADIVSILRNAEREGQLLAPRPSSTRQSRHRRRTVAVGLPKVKPKITPSADHRNHLLGNSTSAQVRKNEAALTQMKVGGQVKFPS